MKKFRLVLVLACIACPGRPDAATFAGTRFAVLSDPHYYDSALGIEGEAFETYLEHDRKMLRESEAILQAALASIQQEGVPFVVICGDLTKDGEQASHQEFAAYLAELEQAGVDAYVVPGNHDILNPHASAYAGDQATPVPSVTPGQFAEIYGPFGYGQALSRDPESLSYLAEPVEGVWLLAMDSCDYLDNETSGEPIIGGGFSAATLEWILGVLAEADVQGKTVLGVMHHGLVEHFVGQSDLFEDYVIRDWENLSQTLAEAGLPVVLTGHYHAQDITRRTWPAPGLAPFVFDVETGSLATYPSPYRLITLGDGDRVEVESRFITEIDYDTGGVPFPDYSLALTADGVFLLAYEMLVLPPEDGGYGLEEGDLSAALASLISDALLAHYSGDEQPPPVLLRLLRKLVGIGDPTISPLAQSLYDVWHDLLPVDTATTLYLGPRTVDRRSLVDNPDVAQGRMDLDSFAFSGRAGEQITVRMESVPRHNGAGLTATLVLQSLVRGASFLRYDLDGLPKEITATLPVDGSYRITVARQRSRVTGEAYAGDYRIELEGPAQTVESLGPEAWTE